MIFQFIFILVVIQSVLFAGHWFLYRTLTWLLPLSTQVSYALWLMLGFLSVSFLFASLIGSRSASIFARAYYKLAAYWIAVLYFLFPAAVLSVIIHITALVLNLPINTVFTTATLFIAALLFASYKIYKTHTPVINRIRVTLINLPEHWRGKKVVLISDTHFGHIRHHWFADRIVAQIQNLTPEAVFIPGDFFDGVPADLENLAKSFQKLAPPQGVFFATGNHEEFGSKDKFVDAIKSAGIRVLDNEAVDLDGLQLVGVDYRDTKAEDHLDQYLQKIGIRKDAPTILLKHVPDNLHIPEKHGVDLQLSGHTHLGQVYPFSYITSRLFKGYDYGLKKLGRMHVYTSSGAGTWGPPMRVGTQPEIVEITLE
jgi:uncharacterized protein